MRAYLRWGLVLLYLIFKYGKPRNDLQCRLELYRMMIEQQGRIQDLAMGGGGKILSVAHKSVADPPLRGFPEATIKVYTWIF